MVEAGFRSRQQVIRDMGGDPATVDAQLAADPLDIRPPTETEAPESPKDDTEDDMEEAA
jgi:capsid protein